MIGFIGHFDTARDYIVQLTVTHTHTYTHTHTHTHVSTVTFSLAGTGWRLPMADVPFPLWGPELYPASAITFQQKQLTI
jgi:hypothetical protein